MNSRKTLTAQYVQHTYGALRRLDEHHIAEHLTGSLWSDEAILIVKMWKCLLCEGETNASSLICAGQRVIGLDSVGQ